MHKGDKQPFLGCSERKKTTLNYGAKSCMGGCRPTFHTRAPNVVMKGGPLQWRLMSHIIDIVRVR